MAGYGSAVDLAPQDAFRPLLGASWPELARRYLQEHGPLTVSQDAVDAVLRLKVLRVPLVMHLNCHVWPLTVSQDAVDAVLRLKVLHVPLVMLLNCHVWPLTVSQDAVKAVLRLKVLCVPLVMHINFHVCSCTCAPQLSCVSPASCSSSVMCVSLSMQCIA